MKKNIILCLCSAVILISLVGCKAKSEDLVATEPIVESTQEAPAANGKVKAPDVSGAVLEVKEDGKSVLIDSVDTTVKGQIWITITEETSFFENVSEDVALAYRNVSRDFVVGNYVEVIIDGAVMESSPMQATATAVAVNEKQK